MAQQRLSAHWWCDSVATVTGRGCAAVILGVAAASMAGCAGPAEPPAQSAQVAAATSAPAGLARNLVPEGYQGRYRTAATVLEDPRHGPQLCYSTTYSLPPSCEGPDVLGWEWSGLPARSASGTRWGSYELVGTFADGSFTLSEPATAVDEQLAVGGFALAQMPTPESPCAQPADPSPPPEGLAVSEGGAQQALARAGALAGFAAAWLFDSSGGPGQAGEAGTDWSRQVVNVSAAGDPAQAYAGVRQVWGGAVCVRQVPRSQSELAQIQAALPELPGWFTSGPDVHAGVVHLAVVHATIEQQRDLDEAFGAAAVLLTSQLEPLD